MSPYSLPSLLAFAINISLVIIVILDNPRSRANRLLGLLIFCFSLWNVADILVVNSSTFEVAAIGTAVIVVVFLFASTFFLMLSFSYPRSINSPFDRNPMQLLLLIPPLLFSVLSGAQVFQPLELHRFQGIDINFYCVSMFSSSMNGAMYTTIFAYLTWGIGNLILQLKSSIERQQRYRNIFLLFGTIGFTVFLISLNFGREYHSEYFYVSRVLLVLTSLFFAFGVLGDRLLILENIGKQGIAYSFVTAVIFGFYLIIIKNIAALFGERFRITSVVFEILMIIGISFLFRPLVNRVESLIEHLFSKSVIRYRQKYIRFSKESFPLVRIADFTNAVTVFLKDALSISRTEILIDIEGNGQFKGVSDPMIMLTNGGAISELLLKERKLHRVEELLPLSVEDDRLISRFYEDGYFLPLHGDKGVIGILSIGPPESRKSFTIDETEFLTFFSNSISVVVERNVLIEKVRFEENRAAQMEKLAALGRLTAGIAHEFRNPLNIISTSAQTILRNPKNIDVLKETAKFILDETDRLGRTVDSFLQFAKPHSPVWEKVHLEQLIDDAIRSLHSKIAENKINIIKEVSPSLGKIVTSPDHLKHCLENLAMNSIEASGINGTIMMRARVKNETSIIIEIQDNGPGIPVEHHKKVFDPFFTTKKTGTGLGLSIVYMMIQSIRGSVTFSSDTSGTVFIIELPMNGEK